MKSITPDDGGCLDYISAFLDKKGFENEILTYGEVKNLWSIHRTNGPLLIFLGMSMLFLLALKKNGLITHSLVLMIENIFMEEELVI